MTPPLAILRGHERAAAESAQPAREARPQPQRSGEEGGTAQRAERDAPRRVEARAAGGSDEQSVGPPDADARSPHAKRSAGAAAVAMAG